MGLGSKLESRLARRFSSGSSSSPPESKAYAPHAVSLRTRRERPSRRAPTPKKGRRHILDPSRCSGEPIVVMVGWEPPIPHRHSTPGGPWLSRERQRRCVIPGSGALCAHIAGSPVCVHLIVDDIGR
jgi:hypothetical protein